MIIVERQLPEEGKKHLPISRAFLDNAIATSVGLTTPSFGNHIPP